MTETKINYFMNYLKGLACLGVVIFHVKFPNHILDGVIQSVFRFAIPLFFMVSGYFCDTINREMLAKKLPFKCKHILKISIVGCVYYFAFQMLIAIFGDHHGRVEDIIDRLKFFFNGKKMVEWVVFNQDPFINIMWFTFALLYCYLLLWIFNRFNLYGKVFYLIPVLIGAHMIMGNILVMFGITISKLYYRNFLLFGLPFLLLGVWMRRNRDKILGRFSTSCAGWCMLTGTVLSVVEWFVFGRREMFFGSILFVVGAFVYALHRPEAKQSSFITTIGDKYSLFVYIVHYSLISVLDRFAYKLLPDGGGVIVYDYSKPFLIFAISVLGAYVFYSILKVRNSRKENENA